MKKLLIVFIFLGLMGGVTVNADDWADNGYSSTGNWIINGQAGTAGVAQYILYYSEIKKTMAILVIAGTSSSKLYCFENDNPKLFAHVKASIEKNLDSKTSTTTLTRWATINIMIKTINGINYIKGIVPYGPG